MNKSKQVLESRRRQLEAFMQGALAMPAVAGSAAMQNFLGLEGPPDFGVDPSGETLLDAARQGDLAVVTRLVGGGPLHVDPNSASDAAGRRPIHLAAFFGHVPVLKLLLAADADLEVTAEEQAVPGLRPLHMAAMSGQIGAVHALVAAGVRHQQKNRSLNLQSHVAAPTTDH